MTYPVKAPKKLIEVALPLDAINKESAKDKNIRQGHPSTLHLWWARRPVTAVRAIIFAQLVNDPSWEWEMNHPGETPPGYLKGGWTKSRSRLFGIIKELALWENTTNERVLKKAKEEIYKSWRETCDVNKDHPWAAELFNPNKLPGLHDPFAGGGTIPLEAQRLGLDAYASDLNPVAVLINKAMIEIPPKFAGRTPVGPQPENESGKSLGLGQDGWPGASGLAEDVRRYGKWMRDEAEKKIGHLYPKVEITEEIAKDRPDLKPLVGQKLTVIAWIWARTVKSPNPIFNHAEVPLVSSFVLSSKEGKGVYVQPILEKDQYWFTVKTGTIPLNAELGTSAGKKKAFKCLLSDKPISYDYIRKEGKAGRMGAKLMAIVVKAGSSRVYLDPLPEHEQIAKQANPQWRPELPLPKNPRDFKTPNYGLTSFGDLFTPRQLVALTTFSELVKEAMQKVYQDALLTEIMDEGKGIEEGGFGARAYSEAIGTFLGLGISKLVDSCNNLVSWKPSMNQSIHLFTKQAIPMIWDYAEPNVFAGAMGDPLVSIKNMMKVLLELPVDCHGKATHADAQRQKISNNQIVSTDPPYYDNIGYAELSDFFYIWLRNMLKPVFPSLFATITVPKTDELVATPYRHGGKEKAESFFLTGMTEAMQNLANQAHPGVPVTIYYAFKQAEKKKGKEGVVSTGWETFLEALFQAGLALTGTWPMRTESATRPIGSGKNALASSIVMVCRPRPKDAPTTSRRQFLRELKQVLPEALEDMTKGTGDGTVQVAPVDLSQAIIGPGMAVFSKYSAVLEADGTPMSVGTALRLINGFLADPELDPDTQFCLHWFEQYGWREGVFGQADVLARSKGTSVEGVRDSGVLFAEGGKVRLLRENELEAGWNPESDGRIPVWEALHQMIRALKNSGPGAAGKILASPSVLPMADGIRQLVYRLFTLCERAGWSEEAKGYDMLGKSWDSIEEEIVKSPAPAQGTLSYQ